MHLLMEAAAPAAPLVAAIIASLILVWLTSRRPRV